MVRRGRRRQNGRAEKKLFPSHRMFVLKLNREGPTLSPRPSPFTGFGKNRWLLWNGMGEAWKRCRRLTYAYLYIQCIATWTASYTFLYLHSLLAGISRLVVFIFYDERNKKNYYIRRSYKFPFRRVESRAFFPVSNCAKTSFNNNKKRQKPSTRAQICAKISQHELTDSEPHKSQNHIEVVALSIRIK